MVRFKAPCSKSSDKRVFSPHSRPSLGRAWQLIQELLKTRKYFADLVGLADVGHGVDEPAN